MLPVINYLRKNGCKLNLTGLLIVLYLYENPKTSSVKLSEWLDMDIKDITYHIGNLRRLGYVVRVGWTTEHGLALNSRSGRLSTTSRNAGTYELTRHYVGMFKKAPPFAVQDK